MIDGTFMALVSTHDLVAQCCEVPGMVVLVVAVTTMVVVVVIGDNSGGGALIMAY